MQICELPLPNYFLPWRVPEGDGKSRARAVVCRGHSAHKWDNNSQYLAKIRTGQATNS